MERKKRSKGSVWEFCYANKFFGMFGFEIRACGQKLFKFCTLTHIHTTAAKLVVRILYQVWRRVAACGCVWLRVAACGGVWRRVVACGGVWRRVAACGGMWRCVAACYGVCRRVVACGGVWRRVAACMCVCGGVWWRVAAGSGV